MIELNMGTAPRPIRWLAKCTVLAIVVLTAGPTLAQDFAKPWVAPDEAREVINPVPATPENLEAGAGLFKDNCVLCHGTKGKGDGIWRCVSKKGHKNLVDSLSRPDRNCTKGVHSHRRLAGSSEETQGTASSQR
jgi:hypothetical protein